MFNLSSLFVTIKAKDDELKKQLGSVKDNIASTAKSVAAAVSDTTTGAVKSMTSGLSAAGVALGTAVGGGVIGIVSKMADAVTGFLKDTVAGSEELTAAWGELTGAFSELISSITGISGSIKEQFAEMFKPAIGDAIEFVTRYVRAIQSLVVLAKPWIDAAKEGIKSIVEKAQPAFEAFQEVVTIVFQNVGYAVGAGVEHFGAVKTAVIEATAPAIEALKQIPTYIAAAFGSTQVQTIVGWGTAIKEWVVDKLELAGLFIRNWPDFLSIAAIQINQSITDIGAVFQSLATNAQNVGSYFASNWRQLIVDALSSVGTAFVNLEKNFANLALAIGNFAAGKGWHFDFTPILDGFKATADKLPEMVAPKFVDVSTQAIKEINDKIVAQDAGRKAFKFHVDEKKKIAETVTAKQAESTAFKSQTLGSADLRSKILEGIYSRDKSDVPKSQLEEAKKTNAHLEKLAEEAKKPKAATLG